MKSHRLSKAKKIFFGTFVMFMTVLCFESSFLNNFLRNLENRTLDLRFLSRGSEAKRSPELLVILLDDEAVLEYGKRSPTPRKLIADLIDKTLESGAKAVGVDVIFDRSYNKEEDEYLVSKLQKHKDKVVLVSEKPDRSEEHKVLEIFSQNTLIGFTRTIAYDDEVYRWMDFGNKNDNFSFAQQIYRLVEKKSPPLNEVQLLDFKEGPIRADQEAWVSTISASTVKFLPQEFFKDKVVFIGSGIAEHLGDVFLTPFSRSYNNYKKAFGVEYHAIAYCMLKQGVSYNQVSPKIQLITLISITLISYITAIYGSLLISLFTFSFLQIAWICASFYFFNNYLMLPIVTPIFVMTCGFLISQAFIYMMEGRQLKFLQFAFKQYLPPDLVQGLIRGEQNIQLGGDKRELTLFFSDLANFTSTSEKMSPEDLVKILNLYFDEMTKIAFEYGATLDKFIGDAMMLFWNAPQETHDHASKSITTALAMLERFKQLKENELKNLPETGLRVGIHTGDVIVGNTGSSLRFDYTAIGDAVNTAARLESFNKQLGTECLVSENTMKKVQLEGNSIDKITWIDVGSFQLKGKGDSTKLFAMNPFYSKENSKKYSEALNKAMVNFYAFDFDRSKMNFLEIQKVYQEGISAFYLKALNLYGQDNQPWDGIHILKDK